MKNINGIIKVSGFSIIGCSVIYFVGRHYHIRYLEIFGTAGNLVFGSVFFSFLIYGLLRYHLKD